MRPVQIYTVPPLPPNMCFKCRAGEGVRDFFVDLGMDTDYEGAVYLCDMCMTDIGKTSDIFITVENHTKAMNLQNDFLTQLLDKSYTWQRYADVFNKATGNDLSIFCENLEMIQNGYKRSESDGTTSPDVTHIVSAGYEPVPNTEHTESDNISTAGIDPPIFTVPTFS